MYTPGTVFIILSLQKNTHLGAQSLYTGGGLWHGVPPLPGANRRLAAKEGGAGPHALHQASQGQARLHKAQQNCRPGTEGYPKP